MKDAVTESAEGSGFGRLDSFYAIISSRFKCYPGQFEIRVTHTLTWDFTF